MAKKSSSRARTKKKAASKKAPAKKKKASTTTRKRSPARTKRSNQPKKLHHRKAPDGKHFVLADETILRDIRELAMALETMSDDVFWHHVNEHRNDFSNWIEGVLEDRELAEAVRYTKDRVHAQLTILRHVIKQI